MASKKSTGTYTAAHAALGGRTLKTGQSRWFVGYKKHTLRLWLPTAHSSVTLLPLVSWLGLWADSAVLLRTMAWLDTPAEIHLLAPLIARQMELGLEDGKTILPS